MHSLSTKIFPKTKRGGAKNGLTYYITYHFNRLTLYGKIYMTYALPRQRGCHLKRGWVCWGGGGKFKQHTIWRDLALKYILISCHVTELQIPIG